MSLVGKFSRMPRLQEIRVAFKGIGLEGAYDIRWLDYKHILIHLSDEKDFNRIWTKQNWFIANQKMRVFKWSPDFEPEKESAVVPVWVSFPNLKAHLFEKSALLLIAKTVGNPLFIDEATANGSRPSVARVCVEYDCRKLPVDQFWIVVQNRETGMVTGGYAQQVEFAPMPAYCNHCCHVGHKEVDSIVLGNKSKQSGQGKPITKKNDKEPSVRVGDGKSDAGHVDGGGINLEKRKNLENKNIRSAEEPVQTQRWQAVSKAVVGNRDSTNEQETEMEGQTGEMESGGAKKAVTVSAKLQSMQSNVQNFFHESGRHGQIDNATRKREMTVHTAPDKSDSQTSQKEHRHKEKFYAGAVMSMHERE
ncbi:PREDICTED: uncharacterized protein LOC108662683 [Theobroma cacao]|uniref:Uncharacterized protein LOC108662683 n=1 Tax=Theobroma cacao TaxID=3641 RepID=A0AB32WIH7_THECC|nr:PREDICTED: uncharacterized protein LOC108662683 [Theobroma cacao]